MAEPGSRRRTAARVVKYLFFIISLLSVLYIGKLLIFNSFEDMMKESFKALIEQALRHQTEEKSRIETISKLLDEARLLKNKEQLEIFKQNLKKAVNEAYKQEIEDKLRFAAAEEQFNEKVEGFYSNLQVLKRDTNPSSKQMVHAVEHTISNLRAYFALIKKAYAEKDPEKNMNDIIEVLKFQQDLHAEL